MKTTTTTTRKATAEQIAEVKAYNDLLAKCNRRHTHKDTTTEIPGTRKDTTKRKDTHKDTTTETDRKTAFSEMLRRYEKAVTSDTATAKDLETALIDLATAVAYSVLKKCINVSYNTTLEKTRRELTRDITELSQLDYVSRIATELQYNASGDIVEIVTDKNAFNRYNNMIKLTLGDGLDLRNDAIVAIQTETAKAMERYNFNLPSCWMETAYTVRRLNRKVWIKSTDNTGAWIDDETTPIKEIYKTVRRSIENNRTVNADPRNTYIYISELVTDTESDTTETAYTRYPKYADLGGYVVDFNGKPTTYTADQQTADDIDEIINRFNLSVTQAKILQLRLCGYGNKSIATYLNISLSSVKTQLRRIQAKAVEIGITATQTETE